MSLPKVEVQKQKKIVLATKIDIGLNRSCINMMAIGSLWTSKSIWDTDDKINSQFHWMCRIKLLVDRSLLLQLGKHGIGRFIGRTGRLGEGYCIECNDAI